jgi:hypothetical protein
MSRIEQEAIPDATPLILGQGAQVEPDGQKRLAAFICLMTMRAEFLETKTMATSAAERSWIKDKGEPPENWKIWITRFAGKSNRHWVYHHGLSASPPDVQVGASCDTQTTTMVLGELCAHAFSSRTTLDFEGYEGVHMFQVWPTGPTINWWETLGIGDAALISLSEAFVRDYVRD